MSKISRMAGGFAGVGARENITLTTQGETVYNVSGTYSWRAPPGVFSVCVVAVGGGGGGTSGVRTVDAGAGGPSYFINTSTVSGGGGGTGFGSAGNHVGDGGGNGGSPNGGPAGGGAGGYAGNGGAAAQFSYSLQPTAPTVPAGGGGGGGVSDSAGGSPQGGGGVGLYGQGPSGASGAAYAAPGGMVRPGGGSGGGPGGGTYIQTSQRAGEPGYGATINGTRGPNAPTTLSQGAPTATNSAGGAGAGSLFPGVNSGGSGGGQYGGGGAGDSPGIGGYGGGLGWKNNIPVIPGQTYTVVVGSGGQGSTYGFQASPGGGGAGGVGAVRIIWGQNRSFPTTNVGMVNDITYY